MSAAVVVLPMVWATASGPGASESGSSGYLTRKTGLQRQTEAEAGAARLTAREEALRAKENRPDADSSVAFYRKYTEGLLRRYVRLSMSAGRVPSLLGRELFRGKVTNYRVEGFDDMVIFVQDVEKCIAMLDQGQRVLVERIAMQEYTQEEAAALMGLPLRSVHRWYADALDELTEVFLSKKLLEPKIACQEG
jgi:hypothetical protein